MYANRGRNIFISPAMPCVLDSRGTGFHSREKRFRRYRSRGRAFRNERIYTRDFLYISKNHTKPYGFMLKKKTLLAQFLNDKRSRGQGDIIFALVLESSVRRKNRRVELARNETILNRHKCVGVVTRT